MLRYLWMLPSLFLNDSTLHFRNLGKNSFGELPHQGLKTLLELKTHNNPSLKDFPGAQVHRFSLLLNIITTL